jgi:hypothetical protein
MGRRRGAEGSSTISDLGKERGRKEKEGEGATVHGCGNCFENQNLIGKFLLRSQRICKHTKQKWYEVKAV